MKSDTTATSLMRVLGLKRALLRNFDSSPLGLSLNKTEERVLMVVWHAGGAAMGFLSAEAGLEKGSLTAVVDSLAGAGLVRRVRDPEDGRSFIVETTPEGARQARRIESLFRDHIEAMLGRLSRGERDEFEGALKAIARYLPIITSQET